MQVRVESKLKEHKKEQNTMYGRTEQFVLGRREPSMRFPARLAVCGLRKRPQIPEPLGVGDSQRAK